MNELRGRKRRPWYFLTLLAFFVVPVSFMISTWKQIDRRALFKAATIITVLGYAWSMLVSANGWWSFDLNTMLGLKLFYWLPLEEALFYPFGGALCILLYDVFVRQCRSAKTGGYPLLIAITVLTLTVIILVLISIFTYGKQPAYVISQLVLYNGLCFVLWPKIGFRILMKPALITVVVMTIIGFFWDWLAFTRGWWEYHAILGWFW
ncbi:hypothetical protein KAR10_10015, partial [bacterium]|nr:hypothetical protein [bacterium]